MRKNRNIQHTKEEVKYTLYIAEKEVVSVFPLFPFISFHSVLLHFIYTLFSDSGGNKIYSLQQFFISRERERERQSISLYLI